MCMHCNSPFLVLHRPFLKLTCKNTSWFHGIVTESLAAVCRKLEDRISALEKASGTTNNHAKPAQQVCRLYLQNTAVGIL